MSRRIALGDNHFMSPFTSYGGGDEITGVIVWHPVQPSCPQSCRDLGECGGVVMFDGYQRPGRPGWRVAASMAEGLTLEPSLRCHCGDHGFIRGGRWVLS